MGSQTSNFFGIPLFNNRIFANTGVDNMMKKLSVFFAIFILLFSPLASFPVSANIDPGDDNDSDGYDANRDGIISADEEYTNIEEYNNNTNPNDPDTDDGGAWDGWEVYYGFDPKSSSDESDDNDGDSLVNSIEFYWDSDPFSDDTDQDGMPDGWEDTYSDRLVDGGGCGLDPTDGSDKFADPDNDGSDNLREYQEDTNPCDSDSDDDGDPDGEDPPPVDPGDDDESNPDTGATDGNVTIYEIFDPVLGTVKRWTSLDGLLYDDQASNPTDMYTMYNYDSDKYEIFPTNSEDYSNIFEGWIWMGITISTSEFTRIPSVSPDADIIDYDPNATGVNIRFFKDGADNYYVQGNENIVIDLKYRMGTNGSYFNRPVPSDLTISDIPEDIIRPINGANQVKENVKEFLQYRLDNGTIANEPLYWLWPENGTPETNLALIINNLTWYFSSFIEGDGDVPDAEEPWDAYQTICINGIGACRHRSFGFFVTALALGAPTRYVSNEAHAFVEVYVPVDNETISASHWKRIDLGGTGSSTTLDRPDEEGEDGDIFDFDEMDPDDIENMTGEMVNVVITSISPDDRIDKGAAISVQGYVENQNGTRLPNFEVGFGMWDEMRTQPIFEIGQTVTNETGFFDTSLVDFLDALPGENEIYAASYKEGFLGVDGPETIDVYSNSTFTLNNPESVGKGQDLIVSGTLLDVGGIPVEGKTLTIYLWEDPYNGIPNCNAGWTPILCNIGEISGEPVTDEFGNFVFSWTVPENGQPTPDTDYHVYVSYESSDEDYVYSTSQSTDLIILDSTVDLVAELEPGEEYIGNNFWVNGSIADSAIGNGAIRIEIAGIELINFDVSQTDWSTELSVPSGLSAGNYTVIISFDSESATLPDERFDLEFTVFGTSSIELDTNNLKVTRGEIVSLEGELVNHLGEPIAGEEIQFIWKSEIVGTALTENDGDFSFDYLVSPDTNLGNLSWAVNFSGNYFYKNSSSSQLVEVYQQTVINFQIDKNHFYAGDEFLVSGNLSMDNGTPFGGNLVFYFDDVFVESFTTDGTFSFQYVPESSYLDVGSHSFKLSYSEVEYNLGATSQEEVFFHKKVIIEVNEEQVLRDQEIEITGFARDENSLAISGIDLSFKWGGNEIDGVSTTTFGGSFSKNYLVPNAQLLGKITVEVNFDNTTQPFYDNASKTVEFTVVSETLIFIPDTELVRGSDIWFNGSILDDRGQPVEDIEVNIFWDGDYLRYVTGDSNGSFSFVCDDDWSCSDLDHPVGVIPVELDFGGFGYYLPSNYIANYTIWGSTNISITEFSDLVIAGNNVSFKGFIENDLAVPLDREIKILWNGITRTTAESVNGNFEGSFKIPYDTMVGNHSLTAKVEDQNFLRESSDEVNVFVMRETEIVIQWLGGYRDQTSIVSGYLRDSAGTGLPDLDLEFYFDGMYVGNFTTQNLGLYSFDFLVPKDTSLGSHRISVFFQGSNFYVESDNSQDSDILASTDFNFLDIEVFRNQEFLLKSNLIDDLGNPMFNQHINLTFNGKKYHLITDADGLVQQNITLPSNFKLGNYVAKWDYSGFEYYLPSNNQQNIRVLASTNIVLFSDSEVIVGETFSFNGTLNDDMGNPLKATLSFSFGGSLIETIESNSNGYFENTYLVPNESIAGPNTIVITYVPDEFYLSSTSSWVLQVSHNIRIELPDYLSVTNSTETISGFVFDKANRPVSSLEVRLTMDSEFPLIGKTNEFGEFMIDLEIPFGTSLGYHNLTVESLGNNYYIGNSTTSKLFVKGQTFLTLDVPASLEFGQEFTGSITLQMYDGTFVSGAPLLISFEPLGMTTMVVTDFNGTATFSSYFSGNITIPMNVAVNYTGNEEYVASSIESTIIYRAPSQESNYAFWVIVGATVVASSGILLGWKWYRERHLREIQRILESTALALEANMDYRDSIVYSYKEMCKVLQGHGYLRKHFETVREFQDALRTALSLDLDSVARLTILYEEADYTKKKLDDDHRINAVSALRTVIESLDLNDSAIEE